MDEKQLNSFGIHRISARQIDELIGLARGLCADGSLLNADVECLQNWLSAQADITGNPMLRQLNARIEEALRDHTTDAKERADLFEALRNFTGPENALGEVMLPSTLPLCDPPPHLTFQDQRYCFTGTFLFGTRTKCEEAVVERGGEAGSLTKKTSVLVIGAYATESWKHSSFGNKILKACEYRDQGVPISVVAEQHWQSFL